MNSIIIPAQTLDSLIIYTNNDINIVSIKDVSTEYKKTTYLNLNIRRNSVEIQSNILPWIDGDTYDKDIEFE